MEVPEESKTGEIFTRKSIDKDKNHVNIKNLNKNHNKNCDFTIQWNFTQDRISSEGKKHNYRYHTNTGGYHSNGIGNYGNALK